MENPLRIPRPLPVLIALCCLSSAVNAQNKGKITNPYQLQVAGQADYKLVSSQAPLRINPEVKPGTASLLAGKPFAKEIEVAAKASNLEPALVHALIHVESRHQSHALSNKGAMGLMQVLPETALRFGIKQPDKPVQNLQAGTRYLRMLLDLFDQRIDLALAAYNAGEGAVLKYRREIPPYPETQHYVPAVLEKYEEWRPGKRKPQIHYMAGNLLNKKAVKNLTTSLANNEPFVPPPRPDREDEAEAPLVHRMIKEENLEETLTSPLQTSETLTCFEPCPDWTPVK